MKSKIGSLLLAFVVSFALWIYVITVVSPDSDATINGIAVELQGENVLQERGLMIVSNETPTVSLQLNGNRSDLSKLNKSNISVIVDVTKIDAAGVKNASYDVRYPGDIPDNAITILSQDPGTVRLRVEERIAKEVPVVVKFQGQVPENYLQKKESVDYPTIPIVGAKSVVDTITQAVVNVDVTDQKATFQTDELEYDLCDKDGNKVESDLLTVDITRVRVTVPIVFVKEVNIEATVSAGNGASEKNITIETFPKSIQVSGPESILSSLNALTLVDVVDLSEYVDQDMVVTKPIEFVLPPQVINETTEGNTATVKILFTDVTTAEIKIPTKDLEDWGSLAKSYDVEPVDKEITVKIRGSKDIVEKITAEDFVATISKNNISTKTEMLAMSITFVGDYANVAEIFILESPEEIAVEVTQK